MKMPCDKRAARPRFAAPEADPPGARPLALNLQLFAADGPGGEKTETATPKKREDARKKGQVMKSSELVTAVILLVAFFTLKMCGGLIYEHISLFTARALSDFALADGSFTLNGLYRLYEYAFLTFLACAGPVLAIAYVAAFAANAAQVGFSLNVGAIAFKPGKINPISGFKRMFSAKNAVNLVKSLLKMLIVGALAYSYIDGRLGDLMLLMGAEVPLIVERGVGMLFDLAFRVCAAMLIFSLFDYGYQWWRYEKDMKMTKQEVKEEYKQMEGDPKIKSKIKEKQRQISMLRMMNSVPKADVVITNPTHFAVAVLYDPAEADAPVVLAKGKDYIALRIRQAAKDSNVPIVENRQLARALYDSTEIGGKVPAELYQAVAEVLAFVYNLSNKKIV
ncbi:MAG: flagellar biosynthesis protein FlhB [Clostridiales bacterium]|jgi:flagellar biosynthetic protein FlhB|nr:flagellar biosynthesis protein FlhB [Clostridiales bacterium]